MSEVDPGGPEKMGPHDYEVKKGELLAALSERKPELVTEILNKDLLEYGKNNLLTLTQHLFRMAFNNNDLPMIKALIPFGKERNIERGRAQNLEVKASIMKDAVETKDLDIISAVYYGLELSSETLDPKLLEDIKKYLPVTSTSTENISESSFIELLGTGTDSEILDAVGRLGHISAATVEAVMNNGNDDIIHEVGGKLSTEGFTIEHKAIFDWWINRSEDPDVEENLLNMLNGDEE